MGQRVTQCRVVEVVPGVMQHGGQHVLTGEQQVLGEFRTEERTWAELWNWEDRRSSNRPTKLGGEFGVRDGLRGREVHRPGDVTVEQMGDRSDLVVDTDPALPLTAVAHTSAETEAEQGELFA